MPTKSNCIAREYVYVSNTSGGSRSRTSLNYATHDNGNTTYSSKKPENTRSRPKLLLVDKSVKKSPCLGQIFLQLGRVGYYNDPIKPEIYLPSLRLTMNFSAAVQQLFNESTKYHNIVGVGELSGVTASTLRKYDRAAKGYKLTTTLSKSYLNNATKLSVARTLIHESVHAYLGYKMTSNAEFSVLLNQYAQKNGYKENRIHHEFMKQFVTGMAHSLYQWDKKYGS
ncbi:hypothetical protein BFP77_00800 [Maribacter sp. 4U21]|uniref:hypothetical protein n=1 Tax=Maribacter sp. 4U21 TaxID=1889779 RepID=UPI000C14D5B1|nr:hypothetical protein [Maribacter sp. 4U21]PIB25390.1 hypothetical protein BFP77_00800 [Maribacter sp. 4U21]